MDLTRQSLALLAAVAVPFSCFSDPRTAVGDGTSSSDGAAGPTTGAPEITSDATAVDSFDETGGGSGTSDSSSSPGAQTTAMGSESSDSGTATDTGTGTPCVEGAAGCACESGACEDGLYCAGGVLCVAAVCGDGTEEPGEQCDDGNATAQDGCDPDCTDSPGVAKIASGDQFTCALFHDGRLRCFGGNAHGQLGYGNLDNVGDDETPASVGDVDIGADVVDVACGREHTCVVLEGGAVRCWGWNNRAQLGIPSTPVPDVIGDEPDEVPSQLDDVSLGGTAVAVTATAFSTLVLMDDGTVRCFGQNAGFGTCGYNTDIFAIGDNELPSSIGPVALGGTAIAIDGHGDHACALLDDGTARCWGFNPDGALGTGDLETIGDNESPDAVPAIAFDEDIVQIQTGLRHTCARLESGAVRCWGRNVLGELGLGHTDPVVDAALAPEVSIGGAALALATGGGHNCVWLEANDIRCWGTAGSGRLGQGNASNNIGDDDLPDSYSPVLLGINEVRDVEVGNSFSCVRADAGEVLCWGANSSGQIGQPGSEDIGDNETPGLLLPISL